MVMASDALRRSGRLMTVDTLQVPVTDARERIWTHPCWSEAGKVHDWRNHVSERLRVIWETFSLGQKLALYMDAKDRADAEEWD